MSDVRIGTVSAIDEENRTARVRFNEDNVTSGWLKVLHSPPKVTISGSEDKSDKADDSESDTDTGNIGNINIDVVAWLPVVGETVVCLYGDGFNADGYIIGGLR